MDDDPSVRLAISEPRLRFSAGDQPKPVVRCFGHCRDASAVQSPHTTTREVHALFIERRALVYEIFAAEHARRLIDPEA